VGGERVPVAQQVITRFSQTRLRWHALTDTGRQFLQPVQPPGIVLSSMPLPLRRIQFIVIPARFAFVQPADDKQHDPHRLGPFTLSFKKLPPRMRPASHPGNAGMRLGKSFIRAVAVGLEDTLVTLNLQGPVFGTRSE
jgi:hypothetical protein